MEKKYQSGDVTIYYQQVGKTDAPTLLLLHGLGAESNMFAPQMNYFSNKFNVIVPDLRGNGMSSLLDCQVDEVLDTQVEDLIAILKQEDINEVIVGGTSYGGVLTMHFISRYPDMVKKAILCDTFCKVDSNPILNYFANIMLPLTNSPAMMKLSVYPVYYKWPSVNLYFRNLFNKLRSHETTLQRKAISAINYTETLKESKIPYLLMAGDFTGKLVGMINEIFELTTNAEKHIIENSFDPSNLCQPDKYNQLVETFIEEKSSESKKV